MLTTLKIKTAKPAPRAYKLADAGGMFLLVQPNGSKLWRYKFRLQGVEGLQALGAFPEVGLADARAAHTASRLLVADGINPVQARRAERESRAIADMRRTQGSFDALCADWDAANSAALRPATVAQRRREIGKDLLPAFLGRPIASITRLELTTTLKSVEARAPEVARNLRNCLWGIFEHAIDSGLIEDNPVPPVRVLRKRSRTTLRWTHRSWAHSSERLTTTSRSARRPASRCISWSSLRAARTKSSAAGGGRSTLKRLRGRFRPNE